ncbi:MAG: D-aminoacylase [Chloroflexota bacterium]
MTHYSTLITNAKIVDGTGNPWRYGDLAIQGETIAAITPPGAISPDSAAEVVDASSRVVCPGFIDILSHSIIPLMRDPHCLSKIAQGVTTEIMGEGWCPAPQGGQVNHEFLRDRLRQDNLTEWEERIQTWTRFGHWLAAMTEMGVTSNVGSFMGGGTLRMYAMGMEMGHPSSEQLGLMERLMAESMEDGAMGVSQALIYPPSAYTSIDELVAISKVVSHYNGVYITHIRSEADEIMEGLDEAIQIGRHAELPVEIYHLKAAGKRNWSKLDQVFECIDAERSSGLDITADMYPYPAMGTGLSSILPPWVAAEGKFFDNLRDPNALPEIKAETLNPSGGWEAIADLVGPDNVMPVGLYKEENQPYIGRRLTEIAEMRGEDWFDSAIYLFVSEEQRIATIYFSMDEDNVKRKLQQPWITIGTDAGGMDPAWARQLGPIHPRGYGSYARILGKYVREEKVLPLEDAIRKMSGGVAARLGIRNRGLLLENMQADVVVFDPDTVIDHATFANPHQLSTGVEHVWINGTRVWKDGHHTQNRPGQIVTGPGC